jgi:transglutaminase superfamily protein
VFFLQSHIFLCRAKRHWVILDVNRDKYLCVDRAQFESLGPWIDGWQEARAPRSEPATGPSPSALALANSLLSVGILSKQAHCAREARATAYSHPTSALEPDSAVTTHVFQSAQALSFFLGCASASKHLRRDRFESVVARVQARKRAKRDSARPFDLDRARPLVARFTQLRLFYPRPYLCLFDSLALVHFLARFDLYPDWVFGVRADPFEAHCWVQAENTVLNDTVERVSALTPIMVV